MAKNTFVAEVTFKVILRQTYWKLIIMIKKLTLDNFKSNLFSKESIKPRLNTIGTEILSKVQLPPKTEAILKRRPNEVIIINITRNTTTNIDNKTIVTNIKETFQTWIFYYWYWFTDRKKWHLEKNNNWGSPAVTVKKCGTYIKHFLREQFYQLKDTLNALDFGYTLFYTTFEKVGLPIWNLHLRSFNRLL